jgi:hypothetical protein
MEHSKSPNDLVFALRNLFNSPNGAANSYKQLFHTYSIVRIELDKLTGGAWQLKAVEYRDDDKAISVYERTDNKQ